MNHSSFNVGNICILKREIRHPFSFFSTTLELVHIFFLVCLCFSIYFWFNNIKEKNSEETGIRSCLFLNCEASEYCMSLKVDAWYGGKLTCRVCLRVGWLANQIRFSWHLSGRHLYIINIRSFWINMCSSNSELGFICSASTLKCQNSYLIQFCIFLLN